MVARPGVVLLVAGWVRVRRCPVDLRPTMALQLVASCGAVDFPVATFMAARPDGTRHGRASVGWPTVAGTVVPIPG
jgi:hypothetical protein